MSISELLVDVYLALEPFANMRRPGCDTNELACERGKASDKTILTSGDFQTAEEVLIKVIQMQRKLQRKKEAKKESTKYKYNKIQVIL